MAKCANGNFQVNQGGEGRFRRRSTRLSVPARRSLDRLQETADETHFLRSNYLVKLSGLPIGEDDVRMMFGPEGAHHENDDQRVLPLWRQNPAYKQCGNARVNATDHPSPFEFP